MPVKIGLYDFFSYIISGVFYIWIGVYTASAFGRSSIGIELFSTLSVTSWLAVVGAGYVLGMVMDVLAEEWHRRLFKQSGLSQKVFSKYWKNHPSLQPRIAAKDWAVQASSTP